MRISDWSSDVCSSDLVDYDVSSNWSNWQYCAGVGTDPQSDRRTFNPVKQAFDYDEDGEYVRSWVPELKNLRRLEYVFKSEERRLGNECVRTGRVRRSPSQ